ncbi:BaiN/RdsA family NAD(P)/FAD-dependent oxidoreductase [Anaeromicropila herbilytica]|uniref:FAD-dependent oxidoreductase n=1 Tax=Anaeromicropila herbilytica TaxID=2785025 RepID=A0A7R7EMA4_9FIRM|nr:NAD(P)/FAD-dependent oxidoreductase [Anaeromicropila herbilytica]BCN31422.1 FAD-dependent oxidoreductase [Anaeromicropila herbilytica]
MSKVIVVGGGAAGMLAAIYAARNQNEVHLYEKNEKLGKKLFITGKGRCNITNASDMDTLFDNVVTNRKFLYSAFYAYNNYDVIDFFKEIGLETKIERGNRVFPVSDKSSDVIAALTNELKNLGVHIYYGAEVDHIAVKEHQVVGIHLKNKKEVIHADKVIVATGGLSYKTTGSTGDGYRFAKDLGHQITDLTPSLVPFNIKEDYIKELQGLSLKNIRITVNSKGKEVFSDFGEMLFTHFGVSGPVILSASSYVIPYMKNKDVTLSIDLKPALTIEQLDARIIRDFEEVINKQFKNALDSLLPKKLIPVIIKLSGIDSEKKVNLITKEERLNLVQAIKSMTLGVSSLREYNEAVITKGGISVNQINPKTMESKLISNVYFIGEVLDLDALTGGYNLQIAWSTAYAAGNAV